MHAIAYLAHEKGREPLVEPPDAMAPTDSANALECGDNPRRLHVLLHCLKGHSDGCRYLGPLKVRQCGELRYSFRGDG